MKLLSTVVVLMFFALSTTAYSADVKKPAVQKKEVKKHKKVEGTKVPEKAPGKKTANK